MPNPSLAEADEEACNAAVAEVLLAWRVCCAEGERLNGSCLQRLRSLSPREQAYFAALIAPADIERVDRSQTCTYAADGRAFITYDPPYPEACACTGAPMFVNHDCRSVRCARCLHSWGFGDHPQMRGNGHWTSRPTLHGLIVGAVSKADIGHALELHPHLGAQKDG